MRGRDSETVREEETVGERQLERETVGEREFEEEGSSLPATASANSEPWLWRVVRSRGA